MPSYYEVNVSKLERRNGREQYYGFCKLKFDVILESSMKERLAELRKVFTEPEWKLDVTYWDCSGKILNW